MQKPVQRLHFIGIKGVGMSALAITAKGLGYQVTGSDVDEAFITDDSLINAGIYPTVFDARNITPEIDLVILGAAFGHDNPEIARVHALSLKTTSYSEFMNQLAAGKKLLAVAGTHGKTTTTSILTFLLYKAGLHPSWIIGTGHVAGLPSHGGAGSGDYFIAEVDEYKRAANDPKPKFLDVTPYAAIVTSLELDHPDIYPSIESLHTVFNQFIKQVNNDGFIVINGDDPELEKIKKNFPNKRFITYGFNPTADYQITPDTTDKPGSTFSISHPTGSLGPITIAIPGKHNQYNATAAIIVAREIGLDDHDIQTILPDFKNVERRFDLLGQYENRVIIDDYAHHPTAVAMTLAAAKTEYPKRPLWCFFMPHTYSRTKALLKEFGQAFTDADSVVITDIFGSAREGQGDITALDLVAEIKRHHDQVYYVPKDEIVAYVKQHTPDDAVIITMGAGDIYKYGKELVEAVDKGAPGSAF